MANFAMQRLLERINKLETECVRLVPGKVAQVSPLKVTFNGTTATAVTIASATFTVGQQVNVLYLAYSKPVVLPII